MLGVAERLAGDFLPLPRPPGEERGLAGPLAADWSCTCQGDNGWAADHPRH